MSSPVEFRVADGTQVNHGGVLYAAGETFKADPDDVKEAIQREYVAPVAAKPTKAATKGGTA